MVQKTSYMSKDYISNRRFTCLLRTEGHRKPEPGNDVAGDSYHKPSPSQTTNTTTQINTDV